MPKAVRQNSILDYRYVLIKASASPFQEEWEPDGDLSATVPSSDNMQRVLIDACGWVAVVEAGINIDIALAELIGPSEICVFPAVKEELELIAKNGGDSMLLPLLNAKATIIEADVASGTHPDDQLFDLSLKNKWRIITIDRHLKHRLADAGLPWIEVQGHKRLVLLEN